MNVVLNPANDDWLAIQLGQDAAQVSMQLFAQRMGLAETGGDF